MASTAHKTEEEVEEHYDPPEVLDAKIEQLASWIRYPFTALTAMLAAYSLTTGTQGSGALLGLHRSGNLDSCWDTGLQGTERSMEAEG